MCECFFVSFWFAYAKTKTSMTLQHMLYNTPCLSANCACWAASYGFISHSVERLAATLSGLMQCVQYRDVFLQLHIWTWPSLRAETQSQPSKSNDNGLALINLSWSRKILKKCMPTYMSENINNLFCQSRLVQLTSHTIKGGHLSLSLILQSELWR